MLHADSFETFDASTLPVVIARYLIAQGNASKRQAIATTFAPDARVTDEGISYEGRQGIRAWLNKTASEYTYTTTLTGQRQDGPGRWTVLTHLEGDFPGGVVDLRFRFTIRQHLIAELTIAP